MSHLIVFLLQGTIELTGITALSMAIARVPLQWKVIVPFGATLTLILYLIRLLPFTFGIHTLAALMLIVLFIMKTSLVPVLKICIVVTSSIIILSLLELLFFNGFFYITNFELKKALDDKVLWSLIAIPQSVTMIIFAVLVSRFIKPQKDLWNL